MLAQTILHVVTGEHYRFLSSLAVAYLSSVVMLSSVPALIGMSWSLGVLPVLISGPFCKEKVRGSATLFSAVH